MKRFLTIALIAIGLLGLSVTASYAGAACMPGCDCPAAGSAPGPQPWAPGGYNPPAGPNGLMNHGGILGMMENHSNDMRLRDKSYGRQMVYQNDNGIGMTCFDHALAMTSRLGDIFSDVGAPASFPAANGVVFKSQIFSPAAGSDKFLLQDLNNVVIPQMSNHINDFGNSLSTNLGATALSGFMAALMGAFNGLLAPITSAVNALNSAFSTLNGLLSTLKNAMKLLQIIPGIPAFYVVINGLMVALNAAWAAVKAFINGTIHALQAALRSVVQALISWLMGGATDITGASNGSNGECDRIQELWGNGQPPTFQNQNTGDYERALVGTGRQGGTPYFSFGQLLSMNPPGAGTGLLSELTNSSNTSIINAALSDVGAGGGLNKPGNILTWPTSPPIPAKIWTTGGQLPSQIISGM